MPSIRAKDFISQFYAYKGGAKPKNAKASVATSEFNGLNNAQNNSDFGTGSSTLQNYTDPLTGKTQKQLVTNNSLSPDLQGAKTDASQGLTSNLGFLNQNPDQQIAGITGGTNPLYNSLEHQRGLDENAALGRLALKAQGTGNLNSTTYGAGMGTVGNESLARQNNNALQALQYGNNLADQNAQINQNALTGLAGLTYPLASGANNNLMTGLQGNNQTNLANANAQTQVNMANTNAQNAYNQQQAASKGNMIGGGIGALASIGLAPFTGGASLLGLPGALSAFGGSQGGSSLPSYGGSGFSNPFSSGPSAVMGSNGLSNAGNALFSSGNMPLVGLGA